MSAFPDCPAHDVKVKLMFAELDVNRSQAIDIEGMIVVFKRLNVGFSTATVNDLFEKADVNGDAVVSLTEFRRFGEAYPTLLDCLYYRAKDYWTDVAQKEGIEETRRMLDELREREAQARRAQAQGRLDTEEAERRLQAQINALLDAQRRETEAKANIDAAHEVTERARAQLRDRVAELNAAKDMERQRQLELSERQRVLEAAIRRLQVQEGEVTKAQERLRDIERLLAEQQREVERQIAGAERCRAEAELEEQRERETHDIAAEALRSVHKAAETVATAEERLADSADQEKAAAMALRDASEDTARHLARRDAEQKAVLAAKQMEAARITEVAAAHEAVAEYEHILQQQVQENQDFVDKRRQVDNEESPLVEQEVKLREQRENLERKESRLRTDFTVFAGRSTHQRVESPMARSGSLVKVSPPRQVQAVPAAGAGAAGAGVSAAASDLPYISSPRGPIMAGGLAGIGCTPLPVCPVNCVPASPMNAPIANPTIIHSPTLAVHSPSSKEPAGSSYVVEQKVNITSGMSTTGAARPFPAEGGLPTQTYSACITGSVPRSHFA